MAKLAFFNFLRFTQPIPSAHAAWLAQEQVCAFYKISAMAIIGNIIVGIIFAGVAASLSGIVPVLIIIFAVIYMCATRYLGNRRYQSRPDKSIGVGEELLWIKAHSLTVGAAWGLILAVAIVLAGTDNPEILGLVLPGLMFAGSLSLKMIYSAATRFIILVTVAACLSFAYVGTPAAWLTLVAMLAYATFFTWRTKLSSTSFAMRVVRSKEAKEASETVQLLLHDYEEHGADWLWETDAEGKIVTPSPRFIQSIGIDQAVLESVNLITLFDEGHERDILKRLLEKGHSFRDMVMKLVIDDSERWWSLSGHVVENAAGTVTGMRGVATDVSAAKQADAKIAYLAHYDSLTELPNRSMFHEALVRVLSRRRGDAIVGLLYLDIDHFKSINDTLGHGFGDQFLKIVASRIESCLGMNDMVARLGGDEFAIMLPTVRDPDQVLIIGNAIVAAIAEPVMIENHPVNAGVSIGITFSPSDGITADALMKNADLALYHAKENGRQRCSIFEIGMHKAMQAKRMIEIDLRSALEHDQLELYYQPLVNLQTGQTCSYEALLRWNHPDGMIMPDVFIPVAEENGLIIQLGEWVIRTALMEAAHWPSDLGVSVNLSPSQMRSPNLVPTVINALAASGVAVQRLELEITESVLMHDTEANLAVLHKLRGLGVRIALDDFGTGYSSLNYLRSFPFDKIKIDRCFVDEVDSRSDSRAIVRAVTGLAANLGIITTAEGVERADQLEELRREGCTEVQGYFFSRPVQAHYLARRNVAEEESDPAVEKASPNQKVA